MTIENLLEKFKSEGIILAVIPFVGSLAAFAFETGYLTFYDVPYEVISLGLYRIVIAVLWLSLPLAIVWMLAAPIIAIALSTNTAIKNLSVFLLCVGAITVIVSKTGFTMELFWTMSSPLLFSVLSLFAWLLCKQGPVEKKLPALKDGQAIATNARRISDIYITPFMLTIITLVLVSIVGYWTAKLVGRNWVIDDEPTFILVRKYDDAYIFKEYDPRTMKVAGRVQIINSSEAKAMVLRQVVLSGLVSKFGDDSTDMK